MNIPKMTVAKLGTKIVLCLGIDRVVTEVVKTITPADATLATRLLLKTGSLGISTAATSIASREIDEMFDSAVMFKAEMEKALLEMEEVNDGEQTGEERADS